MQLDSVSVLFLFGSRRRLARWNCDWSSDVCSSDLRASRDARLRQEAANRRRHRAPDGSGGSFRIRNFSALFYRTSISERGGRGSYEKDLEGFFGVSERAVD